MANNDDTYMIIHIEIPYNCDDRNDIEDAQVKDIFIGKKSSENKYTNCEKFQIGSNELDKLGSTNYDITITDTVEPVEPGETKTSETVQIGQPDETKTSETVQNGQPDETSETSETGEQSNVNTPVSGDNTISPSQIQLADNSNTSASTGIL